MNEKEYQNTYAIPANYTDAGKLFGGMLEVRNTVETIFLLLAIGYPESLLPVNLTIKIIIMTVTLLPLGILALMGISGDSVLQYLGHVVRFGLRKRKLHFRRVDHIVSTKERKQERKKAAKPKRK